MASSRLTSNDLSICLLSLLRHPAVFEKIPLQLRDRAGSGAGMELLDLGRGQIRQQQRYCCSILALDCQIFQGQYQEWNGSAVDRAAGVAVVQSDNCHKDLLQM